MDELFQGIMEFISWMNENGEGLYCSLSIGVMLRSEIKDDRKDN